MNAHDAEVSAGHWYTPTPWSIMPRESDSMDDEGFATAPIGIESADGLTTVAEACGGLPFSEAYANAERIVACVNAMQGIADPGALVPALRQVCAVLRAIANSPQGSLDRDAVRGELNVALRALDGVPACSVGSTVRESDND